MVRISKSSSKIAHRRIQQKEKSQPVIDESSSSKILNVVRQALLNAAEELVAQQQTDGQNLIENQHPIPFHTLDINNNDLKKSRQRNGNAIKKKKIQRKNKKVSKNYRRK